MSELNLDASKQYAYDHSVDGGRTWEAGTAGHCSAWVVAEALHAGEEGRPVEVDGPIVTISHDDGMDRWTPTT